MMAGLVRAMSAIFWGAVLLFMVLTIWAVVAVQLIHPLNKEIYDGSTDRLDTCMRCPRAFESTFQACLTFSVQIVTGDSWGRETLPIIETYPQTALFFALVHMSVGLAIINLIL